MPEISVIIPCYNVEKYLAECLDSVLGQSFEDFEAICVNDGSSDKTADILAQYAAKDKRIRVITQENKGVVFSRNRAIREAKGKYIFPLDGDDMIEPSCLEKLYQVIQEGKGDIISCRVLLFGEKQGEMSLREPTILNMSCSNCLVNAALFRKSDFDRCGGYDEEFFAGLEDYDLWLNMILRHGLKAYRVPEILFFYRMKTKNESRNNVCGCKYAVQLKKILHRKYPQMCLYKMLSKISKIVCKFIDVFRWS